jgi:alpha-1,2-mannosyltransferase
MLARHLLSRLLGVSALQQPSMETISRHPKIAHGDCAPGTDSGRVLEPLFGRFKAALSKGEWINRERIYVYGSLLFALNLVAIAASLAYGIQHRTNSQPLALDFAKCVAASSLALNGHPADAYNNARQWEAEKAASKDPHVGFEVWDYPPTFLLMVLPFSPMGYDLALLVWDGLTLVAYLLIVGAITKRRDALWLAFTFPASIMNLIEGQHGMLTMSLLAGGLLLLEQRPIVAGIMFGLLTFKPQFGILIPVVLIVTGNRRPFIAAAVTSLALIVLTTALFGVSTWMAFLHNISAISNRLLVVGDVGFGKIHSLFGAARLWNASVSTALVLPMVFSLVVGSGVVWIWRRPVAFALKAAALATATLMVTPYVMDYDLIVLAAPIGRMSMERLRRGSLRWEKTILVFACLFPPLGVLLATQVSLPVTPLVLALFFLTIVARVSKSSADAAGVKVSAAPTA